MGLKPVRRGHPVELPDAAEDQTVRQYRYLLRTAPLDALEHAHVEALKAIGPHGREIVLGAVQAELLTGAHLKPDEVTAVAHPVTVGSATVPALSPCHCPPRCWTPWHMK